jgi:protein-tyrosine phosphatase
MGTIEFPVGKSFRQPGGEKGWNFELKIVQNLTLFAKNNFARGSMKKYSILFVCMGNICRSPAAEAIVRSLAEKAGGSCFLEVDSAGTHAHGGRPDPRMGKAAARRAYDLGGLRSRQLIDEDFFRFDRILAMDRQNLEFLRRMCPPGLHGKLGLFIEFAPETGEDEISDPYYGGAEGFEHVLDLCEAAGRGLIDAVGAGAQAPRLK